LTYVLILFYSLENEIFVSVWLERPDKHATYGCDGDPSACLHASADTVPHTKQPGSHAAIKAIRSAIDDWLSARPATRNFWGKPHKAG